MQINQLSRADTLDMGDLFVIFATNNGDARAAAASVLLAFIQENLTASGPLMTQYASPNASGFSVTVSPVVNGQGVYLLLTPLGAYAAGTIVLPAQATVVDGQEVLVTCTQAVTTLTVNGNGATVNGAPTSLTANAFFRLRYDGINQSWYRIG
jgi:hypothetical protein